MKGKTDVEIMKTWEEPNPRSCGEKMPRILLHTMQGQRRGIGDMGKGQKREQKFPKGSSQSDTS